MDIDDLIVNVRIASKPQRLQTAVQHYGDVSDLWNYIEMTADSIRCKFYERLQNSVAAHVESLRGNLLKQGNNTNSHDILSTVAFVLNSNISQRGALLQEQCIKLEKSDVLCCTVNAFTCPNVKQAVHHVVSSFIQRSGRSLDSKRNVLGFRDLHRWYSNYESSAKKKGRRQPLLAVVVEDVESFSSQVLQDLLLICYNYRNRLPLLVFFGLATAVTSVYKLLPYSVTSLISIQLFAAPPPSEYLDALVEGLFLSDSDLQPFHLSTNVLGYLCERYLNVNFDANCFIQAIHLCLLHHCQTPASQFCCDQDNFMATVEESVKDPAARKALLELPSLQQASRKDKNSKGSSSLEPNKVQLLNLVKNSYADLQDYHFRFLVVLRALHTLMKELPRSVFGKTLRQIYLAVLSSDDFFNSNEYATFKNLLLSVSQTELYNLCGVFLGVLKSGLRNKFSTTENGTYDKRNSDKPLEDFCDMLRKLRSELQHVNAKQDEIDSSMNNARSRKVVIEQKETLESLKDKLRGAIKEKQTAEKSGFERLRERITDGIDAGLCRFLVKPSTLSLHEIFYFDDLASIIPLLSASPRHAIETDLAATFHSQTRSDTSIAYKLYVAEGRSIKLADWFHEFSETISGRGELFAESGDNNNTSPSSVKLKHRRRLSVQRNTKKTIKPSIAKAKNSKNMSANGDFADENLLCRFYKAVAELEMLGFVKFNAKKPDAVSRLVFGCTAPSITGYEEPPLQNERSFMNNSEEF